VFLNVFGFLPVAASLERI